MPNYTANLWAGVDLWLGFLMLMIVWAMGMECEPVDIGHDYGELPSVLPGAAEEDGGDDVEINMTQDSPADQMSQDI